MKDIQLGDKVRLTRVIEGRVSMLDGQAFALDDQFGWFDPKLVDVEILEKRKPQVGDVIPAGVLRFLPAGTIVLTDNGVAWSKTIASGRWASWFRPAGLPDEEFCRPSFAQGDLTIVYLP